MLYIIQFIPINCGYLLTRKLLAFDKNAKYLDGGNLRIRILFEHHRQIFGSCLIAQLTYVDVIESQVKNVMRLIYKNTINPKYDD